MQSYVKGANKPVKFAHRDKTSMRLGLTKHSATYL
jgi:hypothetical protein